VVVWSDGKPVLVGADIPEENKPFIEPK